VKRRANVGYYSKDVPGGVETSPIQGAIDTARADGTGLKKLVAVGQNTDNPAFTPNGKWLYFQSNAAGRSNVYRCKPDGNDVMNLTTSDQIDKTLKKAALEVKSAFGYALSGDGRKMVFTVHDGKSGRVVLANADYGQLARRIQAVGKGPGRQQRSACSFADTGRTSARAGAATNDARANRVAMRVRMFMAAPFC
jgi:Tol biopolymer transport system component